MVTALLLIAQIERVFNRIWRVRTPRTAAAKLLAYWAMLTAGPPLIGASLAVSSYLISLPFVEGAAESLGAGRLMLAFVPFAMAAVAFTLAYIVLPNRRVPWRPALAGGLLAAVLFEIAKKGFAYFVTRFPTYELLYGALAAIPIFLAWIYLSWLVVLIGASFAATLDSFRPRAQLDGWGERLDFVLLYRLVGHLWQAQKEGRSLGFRELREREPAVVEMRLDRLLRDLEEGRLVCRDDRGHWLLARDPGEITLQALYSCGSYPLPSAEELPAGGDRWDEALRRGALESLVDPIAEGLGRPLKELYVEKMPPAASDS